MAAKPAPPKIDFAKVFAKAGYVADIKRTLTQHRTQRDKSKILLDPASIRQGISGESDFATTLKTTLGGVIRDITLDDLRKFEKTAQALGRKYVKKGITASQVIDFSNPVDRERCNDQIRVAVLARAQAGLMQFTTNASEDSKFTRHHVRVEFPTFGVLTSTSKADPKKLAKEMLDGPLKFDCSCPRHRFIFRYIATRGGFNIDTHPGYAENNFPKITNPTLKGIACKHALRTMLSIKSDANVRMVASNMIAKAQKGIATAEALTPSQAREIAKKQADQAHHKKNQAETTKDRAKRLGTVIKAKVKAVEKATKIAKQRMKDDLGAARGDLKAAFKKMDAMGLPANILKVMQDAARAEFKRTHGVEA